MTERLPTVFVLDDDFSIRDSLKTLLRSVGLAVEFFNSPFEFLQGMRLDTPSCLVLDVRLPGKSGLDLQRELADKNISIPLIFLTAHGDIRMTVRAMRFRRPWSGTVTGENARPRLPFSGSASTR
jgi:FixJ family two-component response regulator